MEPSAGRRLAGLKAGTAQTQQADDQPPGHQFTAPGNFAVGVGPIHCFSFFRYSG